MRTPVATLVPVARADDSEGEYQHIFPVDDGREHIRSGFLCWCQPRLDDENPLVIIHNPLQ